MDEFWYVIDYAAFDDELNAALAQLAYEREHHTPYYAMFWGQVWLGCTCERGFSLLVDPMDKDVAIAVLQQHVNPATFPVAWFEWYEALLDAPDHLSKWDRKIEEKLRAIHR